MSQQGFPPPGGYYQTPGYQPQQYSVMTEEPAPSVKLKNVLLMILGVYVLDTVIGMIGVLTAPNTASYFESLGLSPADAQALAESGSALSMVQSMVSALIGVGLFLMVYFGLRRRKNWARVVGIVFGFMQAIFGAITLAINTYYLMADMPSLMSPTMQILTLLMGVAMVGLSIWWLVLAFNRETVAWYKQPKTVFY